MGIQSTAGAIDMMMKMGSTKKKIRVIMQTQKMSARFGVDFKKVMEDISSASGDNDIRKWLVKHCGRSSSSKKGNKYHDMPRKSFVRL